jgi:hypothetical protein
MSKVEGEQQEAELIKLSNAPLSDERTKAEELASKPSQDGDNIRLVGDVPFSDDSHHIGELNEPTGNLKKRVLEKSPAHAGERAMVDESEEGPVTDRKGRVTPRDGLSKLTRMNQEWLMSDETGEALSPILWARLRKPFISYLRYTNVAYLFIRLTALVMGAILWFIYYSDIGMWVFISSLIDMMMVIIGEVGARRVFTDIIKYAENVVSGDIRSHEDVPNDTVGQSILEGYWWIALLKFCDCVALAIYAFAYPDTTADIIKEEYEHDPDKFHSRFGNDADKGEVAQAATTAVYTCAYLALASGLVLILAMWITIKVTTWFEIVQGFVEHVNALGLVCATATCFASVKAIEYTNSLPEQVATPDMVPIWVIFSFALACVPLSIGGFYASWTEHRVGLRVYGGFSAAVSLAFAVLLIYFAIEVDLASTVSGNCSSVLKFVHEDWWRDGLDCKKYIGSAYRWSKSDSAYYEVANGVGLYASLSCDTKKDDVYAWEYNKKANPGPSCPDGCIAYYGCINRECCDELSTALEQTELLQILAILFTSIVVGAASVSAFYLSNRVHRDNNESILSHLGSKATLGVMIAVIIFGVCLVAIDAANATPNTASTALGLGDLSTDFGSVSNASSSLSNDDLGGDGTDSSAMISYNESCVTDSYLDDRSDAYSTSPTLAPCASDATLGYCTPYVWLSPPLMLPSCTECSAWTTSPPDLGCSSQAALAANPTMACVTSNNTCVAANSDGSCDTDTYACSDPGYDNNAATNGECKDYSGVLQMVVPADASADCDVEVTVEVNHGGTLNFCDDTVSVTCNESLSFTNQDASSVTGEIVKPSSMYFEEFSSFTISGGAADVATAISNFSFCPSCISIDYLLTASIRSKNTTACFVNEEEYNFTIRASTNLNQVVIGSVVDGTCANSASSTACWDGSADIEGASVSGELQCSNITTTTLSDGSYALTLPYSASEHGSESTLTFSAGGYLTSSGVTVDLGASTLTADSSRYQWVSDKTSDKTTGGGYCEDVTTRTYVDATYCAAAGVDMCSIFAGLFLEDSAEAGSECTCFEGDSIGTCALSADSGVCDGCRAGSSGYCVDSDGDCQTLNDDGTCTSGDVCDSGWPCLCDSTTTENVKFVGYTYLFPVPTPAPTPMPTSLPSEKPTVSPTLVPTSEPTKEPTSYPTPYPTLNPTPLPTPEPTHEPTTLPTYEPTPYPTPLPTVNPTPAPTPLPTMNPTPMPTPRPSSRPTNIPTPSPSNDPTGQPTPLPTPEPTTSPTFIPTSLPSPLPTGQPTPLPTSNPTPLPTPEPTSNPTPLPTAEPTLEPTSAPTPLPTSLPTSEPTFEPTSLPTAKPSSIPTSLPTPHPTPEPTSLPSNVPVPGPTPRPSNMPSMNPTTTPSSVPIPVPTQQPSYHPTLAPSESTVDIAGVIVNAKTKALTGVTVTVSIVNAQFGVSETQVASAEDGLFSFSGLPSGSYAMVVTPSSKFYSYTRLVVANPFLSGAGANSGNLLIPLSPTLRGSQMMMVLEWGASVGSTAYSNQVGVPTDLDLYLKFPVSDTEECLVYYNTPACGNANLLLEDDISAPTTDDIPYTSAIDTTGVETIYLNPMIETTYTLWVRNSNLDQPLDTAALRVSLYTSSGPVTYVVPPPPCGNATGLVTVSTSNGDDDDDGDDYHTAIEALGTACPYHDTPLTNDGVTKPFWSSDENIENSEYLRVLCMTYTTVDPGDDSQSYTVLSVGECQRYMSSTAFGYVSLDETCPPSDLDLCSAADDGYWHCSSNVERGIYSCPGGAETMVFCGEGLTCSKPRGGVSSSVEDPTSSFCK